MRKGKRVNIIWAGWCLVLCCCQQPDKSYPLVNVPKEDANFYQVGLSQIESNVQTDPDNPDVHFKKAVYLQALGRTDEALSAVKQAIKFGSNPCLFNEGSGVVIDSEAVCDRFVKDIQGTDSRW